MTDERDEEIAGLRDRLAALEAKPAQPAPSKSAMGCLPAMGIGGLVLAGLAIYGAATGPNLDTKEGRDQAMRQALGAGPATSSSSPCDETWAKTLSGQMLASHRLVRGAEVRRELGFVIVVRPAGWAAMTLDQQERVAAAFDCAIAGAGNHLSAIHVRAEQAGPDLAAWSAIELLHLREQGYADRPKHQPSRATTR